MRYLLRILSVALCLLIWTGNSPSAESLNFVIIQPGQPGTTQEAQPVMDALAAYLQQRLPANVKVAGSYYNVLADALDFVHANRPRWGIVSLGFYAQFVENLQMTPIASTRPGGFSKSILRLAVGKDAPDNWRDLRGTVFGSMLFAPELAACELFGYQARQLPFKLAGTFQPLKSLRAVGKGSETGLVVDRLQYQSMQSLPVAKAVKIIQTTKELPTSPVVWFGDPDDQSENLSKTLTAMRDDPDAASLLKILQTDGFGPPDPDLKRLRLDASNASCRP
ncbi:MAG: hypothetical protein RBS57_17350 [Desulforhabdus sp.]|jgi:ABC-type phosphate/phosphonate transport system substrate-binding protein|nr:hypothetical protein [Desulforhabdus sp.]